MSHNYTAQKGSTGILVIDVQVKLFPHVENSCEVFYAMCKAIKGFQILGLPFIVTEQYPEGLGSVVTGLQEYLGDYTSFKKTTFSCLGDRHIKEEILKRPIETWILMGIEAHVCVLQTAKDLLAMGKQVIVLNDAIASRSIYDFSTAIAEMRDFGARISSTETVLFELLGDSCAPEFKQIQELIKSCQSASSCCMSC